MKKSKTNFILAISVILFLISVATFVYVLNVIKNKNKHTSVVVATLEEKMNEKENINILEKKIIELGDVENELGGHIVDTSKVDTFVEYLENLGSSNNVDLTVKSVEVPKGTKNKILVGINISGGFSNIIKIIDLLENAPYNITITSSYVNKEIALATGVDAEGKEISADTESSWQADITFSILSL